MLEKSVLDLLAERFVVESPDPFEQPRLGNRAYLMWHHDALMARSDRSGRKKDLKWIDPSFLPFRFCGRDDGYDRKSSVVAVVRYDDHRSSFALLLTTNTGLQICPEHVPA